MAVFFGPYTPPGPDFDTGKPLISHASGWLVGTAQASSTDANDIYDPVNPLNSQLAQAWKPAVVPATWEFIGGTQTADHCVIVAPSAQDAGVTFGIEYFNGLSWVSLVTASSVLLAPGVIMLIFGPITAQRFRISMTGAVVALEFVRFGRFMQMPVSPNYPGRTPFSLARQVTVRPAQSVSGKPLMRTIAREGLKLNFTFSHLPESFLTLDLPTLLNDLDRDVIIIAPRPVTHPFDVALCWLAGERPMPRAMGVKSYFEVNFDLQGYAAE